MKKDRLFTLPFLISFVANFLQVFAFNLFLQLSGFLKDLGAAETKIGAIISIASVAGLLIRPLIARVMDTRGRRIVILSGGVLNILVCSLYLTIHEIGPWLYCVRILHGCSQAMLFSALFTLAADQVPELRRTEGLTFFGVSGIISISLGAKISDQIVASLGYTHLFVVAACCAALSLAMCLLLRDVHLDHAGEERRGFRAALAQLDLRPIWFVGSAFAFVLSGTFMFMKTFVMQANLSNMSAFFTPYTLAAVAPRLLLAWLPERVGPKRVLFGALGILVVGLIFLAGVASEHDLFVAGCFLGLGHGYVFPILSGLVVNRARVADRGSAMALFTAIIEVGQLMAGPILGALIEHSSYAVMYRTNAVFLSASAIAYYFWDRGRR